MARLIDADALLDAITAETPIHTKSFIKILDLVTTAPTVQCEGWVNDKDTLALDVARKIMLDVSTIMIPVDVRRVSQLQAKIQVVIAELLQAAPTDKE